jgi:anionic cell wall polymer biosynthesis LytR-Cps2A-Psr (LCP) family protein
MVMSGGTLVAAEVLKARYEGAVPTGDLFGDNAAGAAAPPPVSDLKGPFNILLVGIDPRANEPTKAPLADSILVVHIPAGLDRAYIFSLPRDLQVKIPAFPKTGYLGGTNKINAAMSVGSKAQGDPGKPDLPRGFELLSKTVSQHTGIKRFDAGAIINFQGFRKIVDAMGGVTMTIDETVKSEHLRPDGSPRPGRTDGGEGYTGPQKLYQKGKRHLKGWEALDYVRQRKTVSDGDYGRQRHQQQFIKAIAEQALSRDVVTNPAKLDSVLRAAGQSLIFNGRGHSVLDYAVALKGIRPAAMTMIKLPGGGVYEAGEYQGEAFQPVATDFLAAIAGNTVDSFVAEHPELITKS